MAFYNTINESGQTLIQFAQKSVSDEQRVLETFLMLKKPMAWFEVKNALGQEIDDCSLKRAICDLTKDKTNNKGQLIREKLLIKTTIKVIGLKGKACYQYQLINQ